MSESQFTRKPPLHADSARHDLTAPRLLEQLTGATLVLDRAGHLTSLSQQPGPVLAHTQATLLGKSLWEAFPELADSPVFHLLRQALATCQAVHQEVYDPELHRWCEVHLLPLPDGWALWVQDVTQRTQAQEAHAHLAALIDSSDDAIFTKTLEGVILSWNGGAERLYGYRADEMLGRPVATLVPPDGQSELADIMQRLRHGERIEQVETTRMRKDGTTVEVSLTISPLKDAAGQLIAASTIARDIGERVRLQRQLRTSERRFRALVEHSADGIALIDRQGRLCYLSPSTERLTGYPEEAVLGTHGFERVHPEDEPAAQAQFAALLEHPGQSVSAVARYRHQDGGWRWLEGAATNLLEDPEVGAIVYNFRDITARKEAEAQLLFHASISRSLSEAVIVTDSTYHVLSWNDAATALYGWQPQEVLGQPVSFLHSERASGSVPWQEATATQRSWQGEVTQFRKDGSRVAVLASVSWVRDPDGHVLGVVAVNRDITERTELEQRKDEFISLAGHELKTPLMVLLGYSEVLQRKLAGEDRPDLHTCLAHVVTQVDKLTRLINDFLDLAKIQAGQLTFREESVEVDALVDEVMATLQPGATRHQIQVQGRSGCWVNGDRERLEQVLTNLLSNAIKYSPQAERVLVQLANSDGGVRVSVQDYGIGIAPREREKIFQRYYRVGGRQGRLYPGLGIGLYFAQRIIEHHGGQLWVDSVEGQGSTFSFWLPGLPETRHKQSAQGTRESANRRGA